MDGKFSRVSVSPKATMNIMVIMSTRRERPIQRHGLRIKDGLNDHGEIFADPIVTEITAASEFYEAENYHQDYYRLNKRQPYCRAVIAPKLKKLGLED